MNSNEKCSSSECDCITHQNAVFGEVPLFDAEDSDDTVSINQTNAIRRIIYPDSNSQYVVIHYTIEPGIALGLKARNRLKKLFG